MAKTLCFPDGSRRVVIRNPELEFREIVETMLGRDALELYQSIGEQAVDQEVERLESELWSAEGDLEACSLMAARAIREIRGAITQLKLERPDLEAALERLVDAVGMLEDI